MTPSRWHEITAVFHAVLARDPASRDAFMAQACAADPSLRADVDAMLAAHVAASGAFGAVSAPAGAADRRRASTDTPLLPPGTRIGAYRVDAVIGGGGQARVYRGEDTTIGKPVALKVLPDGWLDEPDRRARFEREARVLAALNHANIATIHGIAEGDGRRALVLELVEGPTLADRLARDALPLAEALAIARQIALALEAAHDRGIIHRDVKPANVKVTSAGVVKVLDFGLAKLDVDDLAAPGEAPTLTIAGTREGLVMGTVAYMSPEQARGIPVDKRTDIWAFGCVLYEMLTGRAAFRGDTVSDTIAAVLERPVDLQALPATTPSDVRRLLRRCLEKDLAQRARDIGDVRLEMEEAEAPRDVPASAPVPAHRARHFWPAGAVAASIVVAGVGWWLFSSPPATGAAYSVERVTSDPGLQTHPAMQPDGKSVAYSWTVNGNTDIYTRPVDGGNWVQVTSHPALDSQPDWSVKDALVFRSERDGGGIFVVPQTGGHEDQVANFGYFPHWSPDGSRILFMPVVNGGQPHILEIGTSTAGPVACTACPAGARGWFPDSLHITTLSATLPPEHLPKLQITDSRRNGGTKVWTISASVKKAFGDFRLTPFGRLAWSADGRALFFLARGAGDLHGIWQLDVDPNAEAAVGGPTRLTPITEDAVGLSMSRQGDIAYAAANRYSQLWSYRLGQDRRVVPDAPTPLTPAEGHTKDPDLSANGALLTYTMRYPGSTQGMELRVQKLDGSRAETLRVDQGDRNEMRTQPRLSPEGHQIVYRYVAPDSLGPGRGGGVFGPQDLRVLNVATNAEDQLTKTAPGVILPNGFSPDGQWVVATLWSARLGPAPPVAMTIGLIPLSAKPDAESQMRVVTASAESLWQPSMSPNGRWIVFVDARTRRLAVVGSHDGKWSTPVAEGAWRYLDDARTWQDKPRWSHDGRHVYYISNPGAIFNVQAVPFDPETGASGRPFQVTGFKAQGEDIPGLDAGSEISVAGSALVIPAPVRAVGGIWLLRPVK